MQQWVSKGGRQRVRTTRVRSSYRHHHRHRHRHCRRHRRVSVVLSAPPPWPADHASAAGYYAPLLWYQLFPTTTTTLTPFPRAVCVNTRVFRRPRPRPRPRQRSRGGGDSAPSTWHVRNSEHSVWKTQYRGITTPAIPRRAFLRVFDFISSHTIRSGKNRLSTVILSSFSNFIHHHYSSISKRIVRTKHLNTNFQIVFNFGVLQVWPQW